MAHFEKQLTTKTIYDGKILELHTDTVELWHIWMGSCEKPLIRSRTVSIHALTPEDIRALMDNCVAEEFYDIPIQYRIVITAE